MLRVTIGGTAASYSTADGWRCNDGLAEKHLRSLSESEDTPMSEQQALALAVREYGEQVALDEPDALDGPHDDDSHAEVPAGASDALSELEFPPPDTGRNGRLLAFLQRS